MPDIETGRTEMFAALAIALTLNGFANRIAAAWANADNAVAGGLMGLNAVVLFACFAMAKLALDEAEPVRLQRLDWAIALLAIACLLVPLKIASAIGLPCLALAALGLSAPGTALRRIAIIALALSGTVFFGPTIMAFVGSELTRLETALLPMFTGLRTDGNVLFAAADGKTFVLGAGCSAFANIALGIVAVTAFWQVFEVPDTRRMLLWCALAAMAIIAINTLRVALIGLYPDQYHYLHNAGGADLFMWGTELAVILIAATGVMRATQH